VAAEFGPVVEQCVHMMDADRVARGGGGDVEHRDPRVVELADQLI
jgi:hypothetical protein